MMVRCEVVSSRKRPQNYHGRLGKRYLVCVGNGHLEDLWIPSTSAWEKVPANDVGVLVTNLDYVITKEQLRDHFSGFNFFC